MLSDKYYILIHRNGRLIAKHAVNPARRKSILLGSHPAYSHIVVQDKGISRRHLKLDFMPGGEIFVTDLNSTNGVYVNSSRLQPNRAYKVHSHARFSLDPGHHISITIIPSVSSPTGRTTPSSGDDEKTQLLDNRHKKSICIGRSEECDFVIRSHLVSRRHAFLYRRPDGTYVLKDNNSTNGTYINGRLLTGGAVVTETDRIKIGGKVYSLRDFLTGRKIGSDPAEQKQVDLLRLLRSKEQIIIGRSPAADYRINDFSVSRRHARIFRKNGRYYIEDLHSLNGTYVNNRRIKGITPLSAQDEIRIAFTVFKLSGEVTDMAEYSAIRAVKVAKIYPRKGGQYVAVKPVSFNIPSRSFIALMGPSGCGKSTLMNMLNGFKPATSGEVYIHGLNLLSNFDLLKQKIGFVPQDDIVHKDLTVDQALFYVAKLRMGNDVTDEEIWERIDEVCNNLKITREQRKNLIKNLSGGQRKRVSIAVELLNKPSVLFLDEPTSPLDPETIDSFLTSLKELTQKEGTTIVMVTHKPEDLKYVDRVIFMGAEGYTAFYGSEKEMYRHFGLDNIVKIYSKLSDKNEAEKWYNRYMTHTQEEALPTHKAGESSPEKVSSLKQFWWLTKRYARLKWSDKRNVMLLILQPLLIALALIFIYEKLELGILFLMAITGIWFGVSNAAKEIVEEIPIYLRERMYNLKIGPYVLSKITVLGVIAFLQILLYILIVHFRYKNDSIALTNTPRIFGLMFYITLSATLLGLLLSTLFKTSSQVMSIIPLVLIPQIIFAGVITGVDTKGKEVLSYFMLGRWGTEALARIQSDSPRFKTFPYKPGDKFLIRSGSGITQKTYGEICRENGQEENGVIGCKPSYKSIYQEQPVMKFSADTLKIVQDEPGPLARPVMWQGQRVMTEPVRYKAGSEYVKADPLAILGYYQNRNLLNWFDSLRKNMAAITGLNLMVMLMFIIALKRKENNP